MMYKLDDSLTYNGIPEGYSICRFTKFKRFKCGKYMVVVDPVTKDTSYSVPRLDSWSNKLKRVEVKELTNKEREKFIDLMRKTYLKIGFLL